MLLNTTIDDSSPLITYEPFGGWTGFGHEAFAQVGVKYHGGTLTNTWVPDASATFQFNGSSVSVFGGKRPNYGNFTVTLDGVNTTLCGANLPNNEAPSRLYHMEMAQGWHTLVIKKVGTNATGMDIDSISWSSSTSSASNDVTSDSSSPTSTRNEPSLFNDDRAEFKWGPTGAWHKNTESSIGRSTSVFGASVNFTFEGDAISLYGPVGPNFTSQYSVSVDGSTPRNFSARRVAAKSRMLYHADNLGSGNHTIVLTNWANGTTPAVSSAVPSGGVSVRQANSEAQIAFGMHEARVWAAAVTSPSSLPQKTNLGTGAIVGITLGSVVFVSLVALLLLLNRRNKELWARLRKGYKVQSQLDPDSPKLHSKDLEAASPIPPPPSRAMSFHLLSKNPKNRLIEPYLLTASEPILKTKTSTHKRNRTEGSGSNGLYQPYAEFGRSRSKKHGSSESAGHGADSGADGDNPTGRLEHRPSSLPLPDPMTALEGEIGVWEPPRSDTLMTASTLIAEDGSEDASIIDDEKPLKVFPDWQPTLAVHNNAKTPTESTASTRGTFPPPRSPSLVSSPKFSSIISAVRRSSRMSYASHFSRSRKRRTRSASPSQRHLLRPSGTEAHSDSEDYDDMDYEGADFYAQDAQGAVGVVRSSLMSLAASQWDPQTPIRGQSQDDRYEEASDFSRIRIPTWILGSGNMSFTNSVDSTDVTRSDSSVIPPESHRQTSQDTQFTLPVYASRTSSLDLPPPFTHP